MIGAAVLPCVSVFTCADGLIQGERSFFDLATLCAQIGLPLEAVVAAVAPLRARRPAARDSASDGPLHASVHGERSVA